MKQLKILVTGNLGYIGQEVVALLSGNGHEVVGVDTNFYKGCSLYEVSPVDTQHYTDIRMIGDSELEGIHAVVHLAALSNDPLGELHESITYEINHKASVRLAKFAKRAGVERFVMASTASVYGIANDKVTENSELNPITHYAKSKLLAEQEITVLRDDNFSPVFLRPATAYGISPRLRTDIVLNNLCASAVVSGAIKIMSDGTPLRPAVHVGDIAQTVATFIDADRQLIHGEVFNVGRNEDNYSIREMAEAVKSKLPDCNIEYTGEHSDSRSYHVVFDKLHSTFGDLLQFKMNLEKGVGELYKGYTQFLNAEDFEAGKFVRLRQIQNYLDTGMLNKELLWQR